MMMMGQFRLVHVGNEQFLYEFRDVLSERKWVPRAIL